jgi:hypothetical protein
MGFLTDQDPMDPNEDPIDEVPEENRELTRMAELLPARFVPRMLDDVWFFGLLLDTGIVLAVSHIKAVHQARDGSLWLDVEMLTDAPLWAENLPIKTVTAPTSRLTASINDRHVVWAFDMPTHEHPERRNGRARAARHFG